jgi:tRNA threonylcarbamoyladenosine biosynthesis protein TsaB
MKVLGLDTSAVLASVAIVENGELLSEHPPISPERPPLPSPPVNANHSEALLPLIERVLGQQELEFADLGALGVSIGPGSFTGLRIGVSTVKGLAYGSDIPVFGIRTLQAMARRVPCQRQENFVCPFMDARKGQVYAALYRLGPDGFTAVMDDTLDTPANVLRRVRALTTGGCLFVGEGTRVYGDLIDEWMDGRAKLTTGEGYPSTASAVARIAEERCREGSQDPLHTLMPDYLRPPDAVPPKPRTG